MASRFAIAQSNVVNFNFEIDDKETTYSEATVRFISNGDTISVAIKDKKIDIPASLLLKRVTVVFNINKYVLKFDSIPIALNKLSPNWTIGIDRKPFNKKKHPAIKSWKKVNIVYYLNNDDGRTFTVDNCRKKDITKR